MEGAHEVRVHISHVEYSPGVFRSQIEYETFQQNKRNFTIEEKVADLECRLEEGKKTKDEKLIIS